MLWGLVDNLFPVVQGHLATALVQSDHDTPTEFMAVINSVCAQLLAIIMLSTLIDLASGYSDSRCTPYFKYDLSMALMSALMAQDSEFYDERQTGALLTGLSDDVSDACTIYTERMVLLSWVVCQWVSGLWICLSQSWKPTIVILICAPLYSAVDYYGKQVMERMSLEQRERSTRVTSKSEEILSSFRTVRAMDAEMREYEVYKKRLFDVREVTVKASAVSGTREFIRTIIHWGMSSVILYMTGTQAQRGEIDPGVVVSMFQVIRTWLESCGILF
jgi:ABC-type multidrug transport system fused ATPase/permease subunit